MVARPHGGRLVKQAAEGKKRDRLVEEAAHMPSIDITMEKAVELENIAYGVYSPLEGFLSQEDFEHCLNSMRLTSDIPWTIPVILDISEEESKKFSLSETVALKLDSTYIGLLDVEEIYDYSKSQLAEKVFKTTSHEHPGVQKILKMKEKLVGGKITLLADPPNEFQKYTLRPMEARILFKELGWKTIVAFQTRNAPHIGHEFLQKIAMSLADGVFINPVIGRKKAGDFRDEVILAAYDSLIKHYFPKNSVVLSILRYEMKYAGPREAIHHAIMRKNFGCTHIIVGRDHAGVGSYYKPYEAQEIFQLFPDLGITPLFFREFFYCRKCSGVVNERICPHEESHRVTFSGTRLRDLIMRGETPPPEFMRPEVFESIRSFSNPFIEL
ncbi:Sulfate adenylyltransferase [archaeon HR01]|nr:Sulfate adenylyltransferase [archaeon HR01]